MKSTPAAATPKVDGAPQSPCVRGTTNNVTPAAETSYEVMSIGQVCPKSAQWAFRRLALVPPDRRPRRALVWG